MGYMCSKVSMMLGPKVVGHMYLDKYIDIIILYNMKGELLTIKADEKFES